MYITRYKCSADSNWEIKCFKKYIKLGIFYFNCEQKQNNKFTDFIKKKL